MLSWCLILTAPSALPAILLPSSTVNDTRPGFISVFDGRSLAHWDGDHRYWRVEGGNIVGETTAGAALKDNTFLIWRGGKPKNFELALEYRISAAGNSGIQFRSKELPGQRWVMAGYQADIDGPEWGREMPADLPAPIKDFLAQRPQPIRFTGNLFEERGRGFLALPGQMTRLVPSEGPLLIANMATYASTHASLKDDGWNEMHLIARG
jgi:hypothetical protein